MRRYFWAIIFWISSPAWAESPLVLQEMVEISFAPSRAEMIIWEKSGNISFLPATVFESGERIEGGTVSNYLVGADVSDFKDSIELFSVIVSGVDTAEFTTSFKGIESDKLIETNSNQLRAEIVELRKELGSLKGVLNTEVFNLKKLRTEAGRQADLGKIVELEEETRSIKDAGDAVERDIIALKQSIESIKEIKEPLRFDKRKIVLTEQLSELAKAALAAEQSAPSRKKNSEMELDRKFALIHSTRFDDLEELEREYESLTGARLPEDATVLEANPIETSENIQSVEG